MRLCEYEYYEETHMTMGTASQYCLRWNNHQTNLLSAFDSLLRQEAFTDVTLACEEGVTLHAHRLVLAACSSYFANLFSSTSPAQHPIVVLKDVKSSEMRALLHYMYRGEVNVEQSQLKELLKVAEGLRVKGLVEDLATNTQTHPLSLVTSSLQPLPLLVTPSQRLTPGVTPSPSPIDGRATPSCNDGWESESIYANSRRHFHSPPHSPYKRPRLDSKDEALHIRVPSPLCHPYFPSYHPTHASLSQQPRVPHLHHDIKDQRPLREACTREKTDRPSRSSSDELRERRPSPLPPPQHLAPYPTSGHESPPVKRRQIAGEPLVSPTPILRTALAHTRPFQQDVSSLVSLANSMIPLPPLLSAQTQSIATTEELRKASEVQREIQRESQRESLENYSLQLPKKTEPVSDDDSRHYFDIKKEEETNEHVSSNGPAIIPDFPNYHLDSSNPSHFSKFVSYVPNPKPEWKRYKQYTKTDLMQAIDAVRKGMTALQASRKYKVPSRTLYDKIKKMGINTIPRRIPAKKASTTELEGADSSNLPLPQAPTGALDGRSSRGDFYGERAPSRDPGDPLTLSNIPLHTPLGSDEEKRDRCEEFSEGSAPHHETSTRGSFSLVGAKVFSEDDTGPLDLTDSEAPIQTRSQIQERA